MSGDRTRLRQVLTKLLANAIKFTEQGFVRVRVAGQAEAGGRFVLRAEAVDCGEEAVLRVTSGDVDVVLMDMQMPGMDGVQATHFVRNLDLRQPHILALTANAFDSDRDRCLAAGMDDFMAKPFQLALLPG